MAASCLGWKVRSARVPFEVGSDLVFTLSFTGTGRPCSAPSRAPD